MKLFLFWFVSTVFFALSLQAENSAPKNPEPLASFLTDLFPKALLCQPSPERISKGQALKDLETLDRIFRRGYAGERELKLAGRNLNNRMEAIRQSVESHESLRVHDLLDAIHKNFRSVADANLQFIMHRADGRMEQRRARYHDQAYVSRLLFREDNDRAETLNPELLELPLGSFVTNCQGLYDLEERIFPFAFFSEKTPSSHFRLVEFSERPPRRITCFFRGGDQKNIRREIPFDRLRLEQPSEDPGFSESDGVAFFRPSPEAFAGPESQDDWLSSLEKLSENQALILDLRGLKSDQPYTATQLANRLMKKNYDQFHRDRLESEVAFQGGMNFDFCEMQSNASAYRKLIRDAFLDRTRKKWNPKRSKEFKSFERAIEKDEAKWVESVFPHVSPQPNQPGWMIVLIDRECEGGCEELVAYLKQREQTILLGENTFGALNYTGAFEYILPSSRLRIQVPAYRMRSNGDAKLPKEGQGYPPHVFVTEVNPRLVATQLARCLSDNSCPNLRGQLNLKD